MNRYRILVAHNAYLQKGGEDTVVEAETEMLAQRGHPVKVFARTNQAIRSMSRSSLVAQTVWSSSSSAELLQLLRDFKPDVVHVHNTFPLLSPSIYWAAARHRLPLVQTLHNFRLLCPQAMFLRQGRVCEDCLGRLPWRGILRKCYRDSVAQSAVLTSMLGVHRLIGSYQDKVTRYIALNEFCRGKFIEGGLPANKILIKPNFVDWESSPVLGSDPAQRSHPTRLLYVGRLSPEKGINVLVDAVRQLGGIELRVAGTGPEADRLENENGLKALGALPPENVRTEMTQALALVMPSLWYENFPRTLVEAFACGLPVIGSRLGALAELIEEGRTGLLFEPGNAADLAEKIRWALANPNAMRTMGKAARAEYEAKYTAERNYQQLMAIYAEAIAEAKCRLDAYVPTANFFNRGK